MEAQELELEEPEVHAAPIEARESESCHIDPLKQERRELPEQQAHETGVEAAEAQKAETREAQPREANAQDPEAGGTEAEKAEPREAEIAEAGVRAVEEPATKAQAAESSGDEDETQLAAIRELMQRASARGAWLTLGEIAEVTEFAEASISAQLRHLRKPHHGRHRVEKRRRRAAAAAAEEIHEGRRGPVIWEYRVLPPRRVWLRAPGERTDRV